MNVPGDARAVVTTLDGNPMAKNGEADWALSLSAVASFTGGTFAVVTMLTQGISDSGTTAILLGALMLFNVTPGPMMFTDRPEITWGFIASMPEYAGQG